MTLDAIINGKQGEFPGLLPLIDVYLGAVDVDVETRCAIQGYLDLIRRRASGEWRHRGSRVSASLRLTRPRAHARSACDHGRVDARVYPQPPRLPARQPRHGAHCL